MRAGKPERVVEADTRRETLRLRVVADDLLQHELGDAHTADGRRLELEPRDAVTRAERAGRHDGQLAAQVADRIQHAGRTHLPTHAIEIDRGSPDGASCAEHADRG